MQSLHSRHQWKWYAYQSCQEDQSLAIKWRIWCADSLFQGCLWCLTILLQLLWWYPHISDAGRQGQFLKSLWLVNASPMYVFTYIFFLLPKSNWNNLAAGTPKKSLPCFGARTPSKSCKSAASSHSFCYDLAILSSYGLLFHFNATCMLPPSLFFVIAHSAIHAFLISWLLVYVTHSIYLFTCTCIFADSCTYISIDTRTSIDS